jgi:hypothetical protein
MDDSRTSNAPNESRSTRPPLDGLSELRELLLNPEQAQLRELQARVANLALLKPSSEDVGRVLPAAIARRPKPDSQLTQVLTPTVEAALKTSVHKAPQTLVDAIFPVMGPAIRKAIIHTLNDMLQSLNQTLEYSLSLRSLRWRWTAWRTGKSFAEVVLLHTLIYRVEQVFLIHRHTGLLLQHVVADVATARDPNVVAGMLTAIQDFVRDSFSLATDETLDTFRVGELVVWVEQGPQAIIAAVIRGNPSPEVRSVLQETLEMIHLEHSSAFYRQLSPPCGLPCDAVEGQRKNVLPCLRYSFGACPPRLWLVGVSGCARATALERICTAPRSRAWYCGNGHHQAPRHLSHCRATRSPGHRPREPVTRGRSGACKSHGPVESISIVPSGIRAHSC